MTGPHRNEPTGNRAVAAEVFLAGAAVLLAAGAGWWPWAGAVSALAALGLAGWQWRQRQRERDEAAEALERERRFIDAMLEHLQDGVMACNRDGQVLYSNPAYLELYQESVDAAARTNCTAGCRSCSGSENCPEEPSPIRRALDGEAVWDQVRRMAAPGGALKEIAVRGRVMLGREGEGLGAVVTVRDVTEERRRERELRSSEERYRMVVNAMSEGLTLRDRTGRIVAWNGNAVRMFGLIVSERDGTAETPEGWALRDESGRMMPPAAYPALAALRTGVAQKDMRVQVVIDGRPGCWLSMNSIPVMMPGDLLPVGVVTTFQDITERRRAEGELAGQQHDLEEAQRLARVGSWRWRSGPDTTEWSRELFRMLGRDPALGGVSYGDHPKLCTAESFARLDVAVGRALQTGEPYELELEMIRGDESRFWAVARGEADRDETGQIVGLRGTLQDVTQRRAAENLLREAKESAEAAARAKSEFLANMSHEIRTPMNGIVGMTSLLLQTEISGEQRDCLETVRASSEALLAILNDVLDFSKIEAGKLEIERVPFHLERMVEDAIDVVAELASQKGLELQFYVDSELPAAVVGDALRMRQILLNFLSNAIKFTDHGSVTVLVEPGERQPESGVAIRFAVSDTGSGLSEAEQRKLFQSFTQVDASTTRKHGGTGLGLSICRRLAGMLGGEVGVRSQPGEGSTFWFTARMGVSDLPLPDPLPLESLAGRRVLVAGNQPMGLLLMRQQLESLGLRMTTVRTEGEAFAAVEREQPGEEAFSVALVDVDMAGVEVMELARQMRARSAADVLPLIFAGSVRDQRMMTEAAGMGSTAYLMKPLRKGSLTRALCRLIRRPEAAPFEVPAALEAIGAEVLLAEDNRTNQKVAMKMLERLGCRAEVVGDGAEAVEAVRRKRFDLVLMDCQMPVMDGWAATAAIRELEGAGRERTPIVALTANALTGDRERCLEAGMDDYLAKPLSLLELQEQLLRWAVRSVLSHP